MPRHSLPRDAMEAVGAPQWQGYQGVPADDSEPCQGGNGTCAKDPFNGEVTDSPEGELIEQIFDIPEDAYGAGMLALVTDVWKVFRGEDVSISIVCASLSLGLLFLNLALQAATLVYVYRYVVMLALREVQLSYQEFRSVAFDEDGEFQEDVWDALKTTDICQIPLSNLPFYYSVIACWTLTAMTEVKHSHRLLNDIMAMPGCSNSQEMLWVRPDDDTTFIVALTPCTRLSLVSFVCIPKFAISILLLALGCTWLCATESYVSLVMNAVAMEFITQIDNVVYDAMMPKWLQSAVEEIDFLKRSYSRIPKFQRERELKWAAIRRTMCYLAAAASWIVGFSMCLQTVLPFDVHELQRHCRKVLREHSTPVCWATAYTLRDPNAVLGCYPFRANDDTVDT